MKAFRFIHAADLHLDSPFVGMAAQPQVIRDFLRQSTFLALDKLVKLAIDQKVDFVLISGDVYDLADRSLRAQIRFQRALQTLSDAGIASYIVHGNHDPEDGRAARLIWPSLAHFFSAAEVECFPVISQHSGIVAEVYGISYATAAVKDNLVQRIAAKYAEKKALDHEADVFRIGLVHTNVDGDLAHANYAPCSKQELLDSGMQYWALGHVHTRQLLHLENPPIVYPGNLQGRSIRETGVKGCYISEVSEFGEVKLAFHALDAVRWQQRTLSIQGIETEQELKERLELELEQARLEADGCASIVRLTVTGRGPMHAVLQKSSFLLELITELRDEETRRLGAWDMGLAVTDEYNSHSHSINADFVWFESIQVMSGVAVDKSLLLEQESFLGDLLRLSETILADEALFASFSEEALRPLLLHNKAEKYLSEQAHRDQADWLKAAQELAIDYLAMDAGWDD